MSQKVKKLVAVSATSILMTNRKTKEELERISCIWYLVTFKDQIEALLDLESKVNIMSQAFPYQLGFKIQKTNIKAQKINGTTLETYKMMVSIFFVLDKDDKERFFEKSFLLAGIKPDIVLGILFLIINNIDIDF